MQLRTVRTLTRIVAVTLATAWIVGGVVATASADEKAKTERTAGKFVKWDKEAGTVLVKEKGKEEQLGLVDFLQDAGEAPIPSFAHVEWRRGVGLHGLVAQGVEVLNGHNGVFVHGVPVIEVTDHQRVDSAELRKERHQQA